MARKAKARTGNRNRKKVEFVGFIKHNITEGEKQDFGKWAEGIAQDEVWGSVERFVDSDYKFAIKRDHYGGGVQASLLCDDPKNDDAGLCLVARAPDMANAVLLLIFKHVVLLGGEWTEYHELNTAPSMWG